MGKFAHSLVDKKGREVKTACGLTLKMKGNGIQRCTVWASEVTCPRCKKGIKRRGA